MSNIKIKMTEKQQSMHVLIKTVGKNKTIKTIKTIKQSLNTEVVMQ